MSCFDYQLDHAGEMTSSLQDHVNINSLWASLIVEECSRLGLTVRLVPSFDPSKHSAMCI